MGVRWILAKSDAKNGEKVTTEEDKESMEICSNLCPIPGTRIPFFFMPSTNSYGVRFWQITSYQ